MSLHNTKNTANGMFTCNKFAIHLHLFLSFCCLTDSMISLLRIFYDFERIQSCFINTFQSMRQLSAGEISTSIVLVCKGFSFKAV